MINAPARRGQPVSWCRVPTDVIELYPDKRVRLYLRRGPSKFDALGVVQTVYAVVGRGRLVVDGRVFVSDDDARMFLIESQMAKHKYMTYSLGEGYGMVDQLDCAPGCSHCGVAARWDLRNCWWECRAHGIVQGEAETDDNV